MDKSVYDSCFAICEQVAKDMKLQSRSSTGFQKNEAKMLGFERVNRG